MKIGDIVEIIKPFKGFDRYMGSKDIIINVCSSTYSIYIYEDGNMMSWYNDSDLKLIKEIEYI